MKKGTLSYTGTVEQFKRLVAWNLLEHQNKSRIRFKHINRHRYMWKAGGGDAA